MPPFLIPTVSHLRWRWSLLAVNLAVALLLGLLGATASAAPPLGPAAMVLVLNTNDQVRAAPPMGETCFATPDDGTTVYSSPTAQAVRDAVDVAVAGSVVKMAGYCAGVQVSGGTAQTVFLTKTLTLAGGYTTTNWITYDPTNNPTILDAQQNGRVLLVMVSATLQGFTITNGYYSTTLEMNGGGLYAANALTLTDMIIDSNTLTGTTGTQNGGGVFITGAARVTNTRFTQNSASGYGGGAWFNSTATIMATTFTSNVARRGGGAYFFSTATVSGTTFGSNTAEQDGGGAYFFSTADVTAATFSGNAAQQYSGGGAYFFSTATVTGTTFGSNTAQQDGGGAYFFNTAEVTGTTFSGNTTRQSSGGGAYFTGAANVTGVTFSGNTAEYIGGGAYFFSTASVTGTTFNSNTAVQYYGGGAEFNGPARVVETTFSSNTAQVYGGGAYFRGLTSVIEATFSGNTVVQYSGGGAYFGSPASVTGTTFSGNTAQQYSGGGAFFQSTVTVTGTAFSSNIAQEEGGGALFNGPASVTGTTFSGNTAGRGGGGAYFRNANARQLVNVLFARNQASGQGAAMYVEDAAPLQLLHTTIVSPTAPVSGPQAIYVLSGTVYLTNTLIASHTVGLERRAFGVVVREWNGLYAAVTTPYIGNVTASGSITGPAAFVDPASDNYHLSAGSAAIDAGTSPNPSVAFDVDGDGRPSGSGYDIGYDEAVIYYVITPTAGAGGSLTPGTAQTVHYSASITFTITPNTGYHIVDVGVDGGAQGAISSYRFENVTADHTITATFASNAYPLTVASAGEGTGIVTPTVGVYTYSYGTVVTLTATPTGLSTFAGWSGACTNLTGACVVTMTATKNVAAHFALFKLYLPFIRR